MSNNVCFIGHRKIGYGPIRERLKLAIETEIHQDSRFFTMGNHGDFDKMALSVCRELKREHDDIDIQVVLTSLYNLNKENPYSDVNTIFYDIEKVHFKKQIIVSNMKMIDKCNTLICYVNDKCESSGAKIALKYAKRKGLKIINLYQQEDSPTFGMTPEQREKYYKSSFSKIKF